MKLLWTSEIFLPDVNHSVCVCVCVQNMTRIKVLIEVFVESHELKTMTILGDSVL